MEENAFCPFFFICFHLKPPASSIVDNLGPTWISTNSCSDHHKNWNKNQSYSQDCWETLMGLVLAESSTTLQETCLWCFVLTSFPTTSPRDRMTNSNVKGTLPPFSDKARLAPAPYKGTIFPWRVTDMIRWLFLGWKYFFNCNPTQPMSITAQKWDKNFIIIIIIAFPKILSIMRNFNAGKERENMASEW